MLNIVIGHRKCLFKSTFLNKGFDERNKPKRWFVSLFLLVSTLFPGRFLDARRIPAYNLSSAYVTGGHTNGN